MNLSRFYQPSKQLLLGIFLYLFITTPAQAQEPPKNFGIEPPTSVLFVGNSFTFYNNAIYTHLRKLLVSEAPSNRQKIFLKSMTISGALLSDHTGGLEQLLASRDWDVVVLQGQSRELLDDDTAPGFKSTVELFSEAIRSNEAEPVLFMTWAYADKPKMIVQLDNEFRRLGKKLDVIVIPVGLAFEKSLENIPALTLHDQDRKHPSIEGTYLAAAVFYAALYGKSPTNLDYDAGLDESLARQLRQVAWETVVGFYPAK